MRILVANLGSTSFKYRLYSMDDVPAELSKGGYERVTDYRECIDDMLEALRNAGHLDDQNPLDGIGFKTVLGRNLSGCVEADQRVLEALEGFREVAPAHNPAYADGIRAFAEKLPEVRRVALFETAFYQWVPAPAREYAIPAAWREAGVRRYGFHGASHKFIAERSAEMLGREDIAARTRGLYVNGPGEEPAEPLRVVSCHLGGSSSVTGILNGVAIGTSMGFSPQSGLPQNNRVGELDSMAIPFIAKTLGLSLDEIERQLNRESGLLGLSGVSNDARDIRKAAAAANQNAQLAVDVLIDNIRHWVGSFMLRMGGLDALCFTAGIGENDPQLRAGVCKDLEPFGFQLDPAKNTSTSNGDAFINSDSSKARILVIPANEELVIAREVQRFLENN